MANGRILGQTINASRVRGHGQRVLSKIEAPHFFLRESLDTLEGIAVPREHDPESMAGSTHLDPLESEAQSWNE